MSNNRSIILASLLSTSLYQLYQCHKQISKKVTLLYDIIRLVTKNPTEIIEKLTKQAYKFSLQICHGIVKPSQSCPAVLDPSKQTIFSSLFIQKIFRNAIQKYKIYTKQPSFLTISDQKLQINIYQTHQTAKIPTHYLKQNKKQGLLTTCYHFFTNKLLKRQKQILNYGNLSNETVFQYYLPANKQYNILGIFKNQNNQIKCQKPLIISSSKQKMIKLIESQIKKLSWKKIFFIIVNFICFILLLKQIWIKYKTYKENYKKDSEAKKISQILVKNRLCIQCKTKLSSIYSVKCKHMAICNDCWQQKGKTCPQCRTQNKQILEMYVC